MVEQPSKPWVPLTDEQKLALCKQFPDHLTFNAVEAIEAKLREICEGSGYDKATMQERADFINDIRHAEAAHGIKGDA